MTTAGEHRDPECSECDDRWNAVAVTSVGYQQAHNALVEEMARAHAHGLSVDDLCTASGLYRDVVLRMLGEDSI